MTKQIEKMYYIQLTEQEPSDEELLAFAEEENFSLFCDEDEFLQIAHAVMHLYKRRLAVCLTLRN